jgi:photosystem II stability/assembly factor-like uncharacterized protein
MRCLARRTCGTAAQPYAGCAVLGVERASGRWRLHQAGEGGPDVIGTKVGSGTARRRAVRWLPALVITAALLLLVAAAACGRAAPVPAGGAGRSAPGTAGGTAAQSGSPAAAAARGGRALTVLSASFVSASAGWLLATPCAEQVRTCRTVVMRKTVDGGRTWFAVPPPDAPPADMYQGSAPANAVGAILFASAGEGWASGPALWQTRDGGATWRKMSDPAGRSRTSA